MGRRGELPDDILGDSPAGYVDGGLPATERKRQQRGWKEKPPNADDPDDRSKHTYYVGDHIHWRLMQLAQEYEVGVSDIAWWILAKGLQMVEEGEWAPEPQPVSEPRKTLSL